MNTIINCGTNRINDGKSIRTNLRNILVGCALGFGVTFLTGCAGRNIQIRDQFNDYGGCVIENLNKRLNDERKEEPRVRVEPFEYRDARGVMINVDVLRVYRNIFEEQEQH